MLCVKLKGDCYLDGLRGTCDLTEIYEAEY